MSDSEVIELVQGNNRPYIRLNFTKNDGTALDLSDADTVVTIYFCSVDSDEVLTTLPTTKVDGGSTGVIFFNFPGSTLYVAPGYYEGEVEIDFGGEKQVLYERLKFFVRKKLD